MIEIKFRVWQKHLKKMFEPEQFMFRENKIRSVIIKEKNKYILSLYRENDQIFNLEDLVIMQYTGLKDKNGVEIYEGDIIGIVVDYQKNVAFAEVVFKDGAFIVKSKNLTFDEDLLSNIYEKYEVIGNVFENPKLLEKDVK